MDNAPGFKKGSRPGWNKPVNAPQGSAIKKLKRHNDEMAQQLEELRGMVIALSKGKS